MPRLLPLAIALLATPALAEPTLVGYARLDAHTFRPGPTSGQFIEPANGVTPPFDNRQAVQGISSLVADPGRPGSYLALSDNGFGGKANSADYLLCVYRVTPDFETGAVAWELAFHLSDPDGVIDWPIVADGETYPESDIPVPAEIREGRLLTGADFDVESMVLLPDGTLWIGDEFGPFLLHFDAEGKLLEPPVQPPEGLHSPDHPIRPADEAMVPRSAGFEAMALGTDPFNPVPILVAMIEKPLSPENRVRLNHEERGNLMTRFFHTVPRNAADVEMDDDARGLLTPMTYPLAAEADAVGGASRTPAKPPSGYDLILIERDSEEADAASHKTLALAVIRPNEFDEFEARRVLIADLLDLADPEDLDGDGSNRFRFPYLTIESVVAVDERTVLVCNDNNYPFTDGRPEREGPDATEFILVRFDRPLAELAGGDGTDPE